MSSAIPVIVGFVGPASCGKGTAIRILRERLKHRKIAVVSSSKILSETLKLWKLPFTRPNCTSLVDAMEEAFGRQAEFGVLTDVLHAHIEAASDSEFVLVDSVRRPSDRDRLRTYPKNLLVYVDAPAEQRHQRATARAEKEGENSLTFQEFLAQEQKPNEMFVPQIGVEADVSIANNGDISYLERQVLTGIISRMC